MKKIKPVRLEALIILMAIAILSYQNCSGVNVKGLDAAPSVLETPIPTPTPTASPGPGQSPSPSGTPTIVDGGTSTGAVNLGFTLIFRVFESIEWSPSGHFISTGPCSPTNQVGMNGWPGGQYLFDRNGNYLNMSHVCRDSGWSGVCPDGGCNLGGAISFITPDTFVRFAQTTFTPGDQRAPMLYKILNNRFVYKGQLFTPHQNNTIEETYPNDYWSINGAVVDGTMMILKSKGRSPIVPPGAYQQEPYRQSFYTVDPNSTSTPFELLFEWPDYSAKTIDPVFSVGSMVLSSDGKAYRFSNNTFTFLKDLSSLSFIDGYQKFAARDSFDPTVFYIRNNASINNLHKYRYQNNVITDLGVIAAEPNEYVLVASGPIVFKRKSFSDDTRSCPQRSEMIIEVNGQRVPSPVLTWDQNQVNNEICELAPQTGSCANYVPLPLPGPQCRSEGAKGAAISPEGVILYVEQLTQRIRKIKVVL